MLPKFSKWIENAEDILNPNSSVPEEENNSSISEPQHKKGEDSLSLNKLIEKRLSEIKEELVDRKGKANEQQFLGAIKYFLDKFPKQDSPQQSPQPGPQNQPASGPQPGPQNQPAPGQNPQ